MSTVTSKTVMVRRTDDEHTIYETTLTKLRGYDIVGVRYSKTDKGLTDKVRGKRAATLTCTNGYVYYECKAGSIRIPICDLEILLLAIKTLGVCEGDRTFEIKEMT